MNRLLVRVGNRLAALVTGLPTRTCICGYASRCGYQFQQHTCKQVWL